MSKLVFPVNMLICYKQKVLQRFVFRHPCPSYRCCCQYENFLLLPGLANGMSAKITLSGRCAAAGGAAMKWVALHLHSCTVAQSHSRTVAQLHSRTPMAHPPVWCKCGDKVSRPLLVHTPQAPSDSGHHTMLHQEILKVCSPRNNLTMVGKTGRV